MTSYAAADSELYNFKNNKIYRGEWDGWMRDISLAETNAHLQSVCWSIRNFAKKAGCETCRNHAAEYVLLNPPERSATDNSTLFQYIVTFMNVIQKRKNAQLYRFDILYEMYDVGKTDELLHPPPEPIVVKDKPTSQTCDAGCAIPVQQQPIIVNGVIPLRQTISTIPYHRRH
jgi:hypothetical protein